jgi:beta-hydroxylase
LASSAIIPVLFWPALACPSRLFLPQGCAMFHDPAGFAFIAAVQNRWRFLRQECLELEAPLLELHRIGAREQQAERLLREPGWTASWQVGSEVPNPNWLTFAVSYKGMFPDGAERMLPATTRLLSRLRGCEVSAFSRLRPGGYIRPHTHPEMAGRLLILHVGLEAERGRNYLCCAGTAREERAGQVLVFDGAAEHFAVNMGETDRTILYLEFDPREARYEE